MEYYDIDEEISILHNNIHEIKEQLIIYEKYLHIIYIILFILYFLFLFFGFIFMYLLIF